MSIGIRLRLARERRVLSQDALSKRSGVPIVTISRIENDRYEQRPRPSTLRKLADALEVDVAWLVFGEDIPDVGEAAA